MKKTILALCVVLAFGLMAFAQAGGSSSSTKTTKTEKTSKTTKSAKSAGESKLTGCLSGPNSENAYMLTNGRYKKGVEVGGNDELAKHVGHQVQLTGAWESSGTAIGENESNAKGEKGEKAKGEHKHFKVTSIKHIADSCSMPAAKGKKGKKAEDMGDMKH